MNKTIILSCIFFIFGCSSTRFEKVDDLLTESQELHKKLKPQEAVDKLVEARRIVEEYLLKDINDQAAISKLKEVYKVHREVSNFVVNGIDYRCNQGTRTVTIETVPSRKKNIDYPYEDIPDYLKKIHEKDFPKTKK